LFDGLNLTWETHEGLVKHNGPLIDAKGRTIGKHAGEALPFGIRAFQESQDLELDLHAGLEAQAAAIADDIAYDCHDIEDGLRAGLIDLADLEERPLTGPILATIHSEFRGLEQGRIIHELVRRTITQMITDVLGETLRRLKERNIKSVEGVRRAGVALISFSTGLAQEELRLKRFLTERVYRSDDVLRPVRLAEALVGDLFEVFFSEPGKMPDEWGERLEGADTFHVARRVADYIAGMTDRYAVSEHQRLFDDTPDLG
jgi:dGTPase